MLSDVVRLLSPSQYHDVDTPASPHLLRYQRFICQAGRMGYETLAAIITTKSNRDYIDDGTLILGDNKEEDTSTVAPEQKKEKQHGESSVCDTIVPAPPVSTTTKTSLLPTSPFHLLLEWRRRPLQCAMLMPEVTTDTTLDSLLGMDLAENEKSMAQGIESSPDAKRKLSMSSSTRSWSRRLSVAPSRPPTTLVVDRISTHLLTQSLKQEGIYNPLHSNWVYVADTSNCSRSSKQQNKSNEASQILLQSSQLTGFGSCSDDSRRYDDNIASMKKGGSEEETRSHGGARSPLSFPGLVYPLIKSGGKKRPTGLSHSSIVSLLGLGGQPRSELGGDVSLLEHSGSFNVGKEEKYCKLVETLRSAMNKQLNNTVGKEWEIHQHLQSLEQRRTLARNGGGRGGDARGGHYNSFSLSSSQGPHPNSTPVRDAVGDALHSLHAIVELHKDERRQQRKAQRRAMAKQCAAAERSIRFGSGDGQPSPYSGSATPPTTMMRRRQVSVVAPGEVPPPISQFLPVFESSPPPPTTHIVPVLHDEEASDDSLLDSVSTSSSSSNAAPNGEGDADTANQLKTKKIKKLDSANKRNSNHNSGKASSSSSGYLNQGRHGNADAKTVVPTLEDFMGVDPLIPLNDNTVEMCMDAILDNFKTSVELSQTRKRHIRRWRLGNFEKLLVESEKLERKARDGQTATTIVDRSNQRAMKVATRKLLGSTTTSNANTTKLSESKKRLVVSVENGDECSDSLSQTSSELSDDDTVYFEHPLFSNITGQARGDSNKAVRKTSLEDALGVAVEAPTTDEAGDINPRIPLPEVIIQLHSPVPHSATTNSTKSSLSTIYHTPALRGNATVLFHHSEQQRQTQSSSTTVTGNTTTNGVLSPVISSVASCNVQRYHEITAAALEMDPDAASRVQSTLDIFFNPKNSSTPLSTPSLQGGVKALLTTVTSSPSPSLVGTPSVSPTAAGEEQQQRYDIVSVNDVEHFDFYSRTTTLLLAKCGDDEEENENTTVNDHSKNERGIEGEGHTMNDGELLVPGYFSRRAVMLRETIPLQRQGNDFMRSVNLEDNRPINFLEILENKKEGGDGLEEATNQNDTARQQENSVGAVAAKPPTSSVNECSSLDAAGIATDDEDLPIIPTIPTPPPIWDAAVLEAGIPAQQFPLHVSKQLSLLLPTPVDLSLATAKSVVAQLDKVMSKSTGLSVEDWKHRKMLITRDILQSVNTVFPSASSSWIRANDLSIPRTSNNTRLEGKKLRRRLQLQREKLSKKFKEKALSTSPSKGSSSGTYVPTAKDESNRISHLLQLLTEHLLNTAAVDRSQASEVTGTVLHATHSTSSSATAPSSTKRRSTTTSSSNSTRKNSTIATTTPPAQGGVMYVPSFRGSVRDIIKYVDAIDAIHFEAAAKRRDTAMALHGRSDSSVSPAHMDTIKLGKHLSQQHLLSTSETKLQKLRMRELSIVAADMRDAADDHRGVSSDTLDYRKTEHMYILPEDILRPLLTANQLCNSSFGADPLSHSNGDDLPMLLSVSSGSVSTWNPNATTFDGGGLDDAHSLTRDQVIGCHAPNTITFQNVMSNLQQLFSDATAVDLEHELEKKEREAQRRLEALRAILGEVEREEEATRNKLGRDLIREQNDFLDATKIKFKDEKKALAHAGIHEKLMRAKKAMSSALGSGFGSAQKSSADGLFAIVKSAHQKNIGRLKVLDELSLSSSSSRDENVGTGGITTTPQRGRKSSLATREQHSRRKGSTNRTTGTPPPNTTTTSSSRPSLITDIPRDVNDTYPPSLSPGETTTLLTFPAFTAQSIDTEKIKQLFDVDAVQIQPFTSSTSVPSPAALFIQLDDITIRYSAPNPLQVYHPTDACLLEASDYFMHSHLTAPPRGPHGLSQFRRDQDAQRMIDLDATDAELDALFAEMDDVVGSTPPSTPLSGLGRGPAKAPSKPSNSPLRLQGEGSLLSDATVGDVYLANNSEDTTTTTGTTEGIHQSYVAFGEHPSTLSGTAGDDEDVLHGSMLSISEHNNSSCHNNNSFKEGEDGNGGSGGMGDSIREKSIAKSQSEYEGEDALLTSMMLNGSASFKTAILKHKSLFAARKAMHKAQHEAEAAEQARIQDLAKAELDRLAQEDREREKAGLMFRSEASVGARGPLQAQRNAQRDSLPATASSSAIIPSIIKQQRRATVKFDVDASKSSRDNSVTSTTLEQRTSVLPRMSVYGIPLDMVSPPSSPRHSEGPLSSLAAAMAGTSYTAEQLRNQMLAARTAKERAVAQQSIDDAVEKERVAQETHGFLRALAGETPVSSSTTPPSVALLSPSDQSLFKSVFTEGSEGVADKDLLKSIKRANKRHQQSGGERHNQVFKSTKARNRTASMELAADELRDEMSAIQICKEFPSQRLIQHYLRFAPLGATVAALMRPTDSVVMGALAAKRESDGGSKLNWKPNTRLVPTAPIILKMKFVGNSHVGNTDSKSTTASIAAPTIHFTLVHPPQRSTDGVEESHYTFDESPLFFATGTTSSVQHTTQIKSLVRTNGDVVDNVLSQIESLMSRIAAQKAIFEQGRQKEETPKSMLQRAIGNLREGKIVPPHKTDGLYAQGDIIKCGPYSPHFLPSSRPLTAAAAATEVGSASRKVELSLQENIQRDLVKVGEARRTPQPFGIRVPIDPEFKNEKHSVLSPSSSSTSVVDVSMSRMGREQAKRIFIAKNTHLRPLLAPIHSGVGSGDAHHAEAVDTSMTINGKSRGGTARPPQSGLSRTPIKSATSTGGRARQLTPLLRAQRPATMLVLRVDDNDSGDVVSLSDNSFICRSYPTPGQQQHATPLSQRQHRAPTPTTPLFPANIAQPGTSITRPDTAITTHDSNDSTMLLTPPRATAATSRRVTMAMADRILDIQSEMGKLLQGMRWEEMREM